MAAITTLLRLPPHPPPPPISVSPPHLKPTTLPFRCSARVHDKDRAPRLLKAAVTGVTELLRLFSPSPNPNRTYLKLPWRPLISIGGTTLYELNDNFKIVRHVESWDVSALEAIGQIFTTGSRKDDK
ncbi:hypothetical protein QJS10_CPA06g01556 [Acorus calamus]|uniref:Uncharacterized protein n=1 Tax=Acorus calamus TaxID=4465 RepID=A0AAV9EMZ4_ACOCL|nr:hypothetical protein QJS10_CPA06g01556 [Acorus calamus]